MVGVLRRRGAGLMVLLIGMLGGCAGTPSLTARPEASGAASAGTLAQDLARFNEWFAGEFNNHEQVWKQRIDSARPDARPADKIAHSHSVFAPVALPALGEHVYYVQQSLDGDPAKVYRQRVYRIVADAAEQAVRLEIYILPDPKAVLDAHRLPERRALLTRLEPDQLRHAKGCDVLWRYEAASQSFEGRVDARTCSYVSPQLGKRIVVSDTLRLSAQEIWINDQARDEAGHHVFGNREGVPIKARKVRHFSGWLFGTEASGRKLRGERALLLHNEGAREVLHYDNVGSASPYAVELAQLTYQNTQQPILKLALVDTRSGKSLAYTWASPDTRRIGLNLGWVQFGLTQTSSDPTSGTPAHRP